MTPCVVINPFTGRGGKCFSSLGVYVPDVKTAVGDLRKGKARRVHLVQRRSDDYVVRICYIPTYPDYYLRQGGYVEVMFLLRLVCVCVCVCVINITQKVTDQFLRKF